MPSRRFDDASLGQELHDLVLDFAKRDAILAVRRALVYRRPDEEDVAMGRFVPAPFDQSQLIIKFATGALADAAMHLVGALTSNPPIVQVNRIAVADRKVSDKTNKSAARVESALNGIWWAAEEDDDIQELVAWSVVAEGPGWYHSYPREAGFGLPDRIFYEEGELSDEQLTEMKRTGKAWPEKLRDPTTGRLKTAESADLWLRRRQDALNQEQAINGESLFITESLPAGAVYYRFDQGRRLKMVAVRERVPVRDFRPTEPIARAAAKANGMFSEEEIAKYGLILGEDGRIIGGIQKDGSDPDRPAQRASWWDLWRVWYRDELYYYVTSGSEAINGGHIVFWKPHTLGEVPFWAANGGQTPSARPEEQFQPLLEAAYAVVPGLNQAATLASNMMAFNGIPRFVIELPQGGILANTETGGPRTFTTDSPTGLDPKELEVIQNGGRIKQLTIDDHGMVLQVLTLYMEFLKDLLPGDSSRGQGASTGPAWTTRLLQEAEQIGIQPAVRSNAKAIGRMAKFWARNCRQLDVPIWFLGAPGQRGKTKGIRGLIQVKPDEWTQSISVAQDPHTQTERITLQQVGLSLWQAGAIPPHRMYEEYFGDQDPDESRMQMWENAIIEHLIGTKPAPEGSLIETFASIVQGRMLDRLARAGVPNAQRLIAAQQAGLAGQLQENGPLVQPPAGSAPLPAVATATDSTTLGGPVSDAAGIRQPGVGQGPTQNALPALDVLAPAPG
jgi:hypothetical protein